MSPKHVYVKARHVYEGVTRLTKLKWKTHPKWEWHHPVVWCFELNKNKQKN